MVIYLSLLMTCLLDKVQLPFREQVTCLTLLAVQEWKILTLCYTLVLWPWGPLGIPYEFAWLSPSSAPSDNKKQNNTSSIRGQRGTLDTDRLNHRKPRVCNMVIPK